MGLVSFFNDLASDMVFPLIPIFLTSVIGAPLALVGLIEGIADATGNVLKIVSGRLSDKLRSRKSFAVFGYALSAVSKPLLAFATTPSHVLGIRFADRTGKGLREAPRDALISFSVPRSQFGRAFGFHRAMDAFGAALGPLVAFFLLPFLDNDYRALFLLSFIASAIAVLVLVWFVREVQPSQEAERTHAFRAFHLRSLGAPFYIFLAGSTVFSLGKASEAFLILRAQDAGVAIALIPIIYFVFNISATAFSSPLGIIADRVGKRAMLIAGYFFFAVLYVAFASFASAGAVWILFMLYGVYYAMTEGVGRAIVASLVQAEYRGTAFGLFHGLTGFALLPASFLFGLFTQQYGYSAAFFYGAILAFAGAVILLAERAWHRIYSPA